MGLRLVAISMWVLIVGSMLGRTALAQEEHPDSARKILNRVAPIYPELARTMKLEGTVRLRATVAPNGTVKFVETVGGSPVLVKAAENAMYKWRWIPGKEESKELVEVRFHPE
jgi:TonB family protein